MVFYIQWETALLAAIFVLTKVLSIGYRRWIRPEDTDKYSYDGAVVDKNWQESEKLETTGHGKNGNQRPTLLKIKEKPQKVSLRLKAEEKRKQAAVHPPKPQAKPSAAQAKQVKQPKQTNQAKETVKPQANQPLMAAKTKPSFGQAKQEKQVKQPKQTKKLKKGKAAVKVPANQPVVPAKTKSLSDWVNQSKEMAELAVKPMTGQIGSQITSQSNQPKKANQAKQTGKAVVQLPKSKANKHQEKAKTGGVAKEKLIIYPKSEIHLKQPVPPKAKKPAKGGKPNQQPVHSAVKAEAGGQAGRKIKYFRKKKSKKLAQSASKE